MAKFDMLVTVHIGRDIKVKMLTPVVKPYLFIKSGYIQLVSHKELEEYFNYEENKGKKVLVKYFLHGDNLTYVPSAIEEVLSLEDLILKLVR